MLTHSQARSIAEARWGRGGTHSYRTNRRGAFYFSCSSHGGFVIDARALQDEEFICIYRYVEPEWATQYGTKIMHPYRTRTLRTYHPPKPFRFFLLEEDCDWCLAPHFAGINLIQRPFDPDHVKRTFDQWLVPRSTNSVTQVTPTT